MSVRMRFFTIWFYFGRRFGTQIGEKSALELPGLAKRKSLQNIGRGSKNQGSGFQKTTKNHRKNASEGGSEKDRPENVKKTIFGALGALFGSPKCKIFQGLAKFFEACFATPWELPTNRPKSSGLGAWRLSPWSFKVLGLLSLSLC